MPFFFEGVLLWGSTLVLHRNSPELFLLLTTFITYREAMTSLCAARSNHFTTTTCGHSRTKTVLVTTLAITGLEGTLHDLFIFRDANVVFIEDLPKKSEALYS